MLLKAVTEPISWSLAAVGPKRQLGEGFRATRDNGGHRKAHQERLPDGLNRRAERFQPSGGVSVVVAVLLVYRVVGHSGLVS